MKDSEIKTFLAQSGLLDKEAEIYLALLRTGAASVTEIARKASINRTTAYDILEKLKIKGLVGEVDNKKIRQYLASDLEAFKLYIEDQSSAWTRRVGRLDSVIESLEKTMFSGSSVPILAAYSGKQGLKEVLQDQFKKDIKTVDVISDVWPQLEKVFDSYLKLFARLKTNRRIKTRLIIPAQAQSPYESKYYSKRALEELFEIRVLSKTFRPNAEISIYGGTVSIISLREEELVGILLSSKVTAHAHRILFEELWEKAKPLKNKV